MTKLALSRVECSALSECEAIIERGMTSFIEVGNALLRIRNERLYRAAFGTFQEYCEAKWQMSDRHAHRLIDAAEIAGNLSTDQLVSESQARPLARLEPAQQREAWKEAVKSSNGKPTARDVEAAARQISRTSSPATPERDSELLSLLKSYWTAANRAERAQFLSWVKHQ